MVISLVWIHLEVPSLKKQTLMIIRCLVNYGNIVDTDAVVVLFHMFGYF